MSYNQDTNVTEEADLFNILADVILPSFNTFHQDVGRS